MALGRRMGGAELLLAGAATLPFFASPVSASRPLAGPLLIALGRSLGEAGGRTVAIAGCSAEVATGGCDAEVATLSPRALPASGRTAACAAGVAVDSGRTGGSTLRCAFSLRVIGVGWDRGSP